MKNKAFTLVELMVSLIITSILLAVGWPLFANHIDSSRFHAFSAELTGHMVLARHLALTTETSVQLDFRGDETSRYRCIQVDGANTRIVSEAPWRGGYDSLISLKLHPRDLKHPTQTSKVITKPLSSTHAPKFIFTSRGSSSGTLLYSDGKQRAVCAVVSGSTGRFSIFRWKEGGLLWQNIF